MLEVKIGSTKLHSVDDSLKEIIGLSSDSLRNLMFMLPCTVNVFF
jgi:hypothetical protein